MRAIASKGFPKIAPPSSFGRPPRLDWIAIRDLVIDPDYQRDINPTGRHNVLRIAKEFDWAKFCPVVVAPAGSNTFAIVDGQHRATAAALLGLDKVPCAIIEASRAQQAAAFAAINGNLTKMHMLQLHAARVAAGDPRAVRLNTVCARAGVSILRYPVQTSMQKVGETMVVVRLQRLLDKFGEEILEVALSCITRTGDGHAGFVRYQLVWAFCVVLEAEPAWCEHKRLLAAIDRLDLREAFATAGKRATPGSGEGIVTELVDLISEHLENEFAAAGAAA